MESSVFGDLGADNDHTNDGPPAPPPPPTPPAQTGDVAGPGEIPVDDSGRQIAQPELIDDEELPPVAEVGEKAAAEEAAAIEAAKDSGRLSLTDDEA